MARSNLSMVQEAIEIQGFITVSVNGQNRQAKSVKVVDGDWGHGHSDSRPEGLRADQVDQGRGGEAGQVDHRACG